MSSFKVSERQRVAIIGRNWDSFNRISQPKTSFARKDILMTSWSFQGNLVFPTLLSKHISDLLLDTNCTLVRR